MDSIDLEVLKTASAWIASGHRCELVTVIKTWGSSPRPVGATLAICDDGRVVGSVSAPGRRHAGHLRRRPRGRFGLRRLHRG
jgi:hypothetical protein